MKVIKNAEKLNLNKLSLASIIREIVFEFQYYNTHEGEDMILDSRKLLDLADELESCATSKIDT